MEGHLVRMGFEDSLERRTSGYRRRIAAHHPPAVVAHTGRVPGRRRAGIRWEEAEDRPFVAASYEAGRTVLADLGPARCPGRFGRLPGAGALLRPCASFLPPSSSPSILCGFP